MANILEQAAACTERGKLNKDASYPPGMRELDGVDELVARALSNGIDPNEVLNQGLMVGDAPLTQEFCDMIGADNDSRDPQLALEYLSSIFA